MINKLLTRRGWRVVSHSMLAAAGIGLLYLLSEKIVEGIRHDNSFSWWIIGVAVAIAVSIWMVVLGSLLAKAELAEKK